MAAAARSLNRWCRSSVGLSGMAAAAWARVRASSRLAQRRGSEAEEADNLGQPGHGGCNLAGRAPYAPVAGRQRGPLLAAQQQLMQQLERRAERSRGGEGG